MQLVESSTQLSVYLISTLLCMEATGFYFYFSYNKF